MGRCCGIAAGRQWQFVTPQQTNTADLVQRLRAMAGPRQPNTLVEAADLIERLTAELQALRAESVG